MLKIYNLKYSKGRQQKVFLNIHAEKKDRIFNLFNPFLSIVIFACLNGKTTFWRPTAVANKHCNPLPCFMNLLFLFNGSTVDVSV